MKSDKSNIENEKTIEQLRAESELKTKWLSLVAHDCKGLFSNIRYLLDAVTDQSITPEIFMSMLPELKQIADKNSKTLESTFAWVNAQTDGFAMDVEPVVIHYLYLKLAEELDKEIVAKELTFNFVGNKKLLLHTDQFLLRFIFKQIIDNAIKYSNKGGVVEMIAHADSDKITIAIKDNGVGMKNSRLSTVGTLDGAPYTGAMDEKGAGLSLVVVKDFVEMLGGTINVLSVVDKGTTVELRFDK
jgi:signal transduction histidine kinase